MFSKKVKSVKSKSWSAFLGSTVNTDKVRTMTKKRTVETICKYIYQILLMSSSSKDGH